MGKLLNTILEMQLFLRIQVIGRMVILPIAGRKPQVHIVI